MGGDGNAMLNKIDRGAVASLSVMAIRVTVLLVKFLFTLFLAKFLGFHEVGVYGLVVGAGVLLPVLLGLGINYSLIREAVSESPAGIVKGVVRYLSWIAPVYLLVTCVVMAWGATTGHVTFWALLLPVLFMEHLHVDAYQLLLNRSKAISANLILFVRSAVWMLVYMLLAFHEPAFRNMESVLLCWLLGGFCGLLAVAYVVREWPWRMSAGRGGSGAWFFSAIRAAKFPYFNSLGATVSFYIDRYLITLFLGLELAGVYVFFWTIYSALFNLVYSGVVQFYRPKLVMACKEADNLYPVMYRQCMKRTAVVSAAMSIAAGVVVSLLLPYLDKPLVIEWLPVMWIVLVGVVFSLLREVQVLVFYSHHEDALLFKSIMVMLVIALSLNILLIPVLGLWGAALALLCVNAAMLGIQGFLGRPLLRRYGRAEG